MRGRRHLAVLCLATLASGAVLTGQQVTSPRRQPVYQVVVDVDPVAIDVAVTDRLGRSVTNLNRDDFVIYEDGLPQTVRSVDLVGMPYSVLVLVDRSPRDQKSDWPRFVLKSVDLFLKNLRGPDRLAVAGFDDRVAVLLDWRASRNGTIQRAMIRKSDQHTRFFEALNWAAEEMDYLGSPGTQAQPIANGRKGVIVFSDGRDHDMYPKIQRVDGRDIPDPLYEVPISVDARFEKSRTLLQEGGVPFYFVAVDTDRQLSENSAQRKFEGWVKFLREVRTRMEQLGSASGGHTAFPKEIEDLLPLYDRIQRDLGTGYHITYHSQRPPDGQLRRVEIKLRNGDAQIYQSTSNYYPR